MLVMIGAEFKTVSDYPLFVDSSAALRRNVELQAEPQWREGMGCEWRRGLFGNCACLGFSACFFGVIWAHLKAIPRASV